MDHLLARWRTSPAAAVVDVMVSRSTNGGLTWSDPVTVAATNVFYDKNWSACDKLPRPVRSTATATTEFDNANSGDPGTDVPPPPMPGLTWGAPTPTADNIHGLGGANP